MSLTASQIEARDGRLTASRVACLMKGDEQAIYRLWQELVGDPSFIDEDLSDVWPVQLGSCTERLNLDWYTRRTGRPVTRCGEVVLRQEYEWAACTLDGWDAALPGPIECKHVGGREHLSAIVSRYQPQLQWQMLCTGSRLAALSVIEGANEPIIEEIPLDVEYSAELWRRAENFIQCVWDLRPPVAAPSIAGPVKAEKVYDFSGSNSWANDAATWLQTRDAKKLADASEKSLKSAVPADAARAHGHGVTVNRDRAGRLSLRVLEEVK